MRLRRQQDEPDDRKLEEGEPGPLRHGGRIGEHEWNAEHQADEWEQREAHMPAAMPPGVCIMGKGAFAHRFELALSG